MSEDKVSTTEEVVENMAKAIYTSRDGSQPWESLSDEVKERYRELPRRHVSAAGDVEP